jgi:hypothetical protein
MPISPGAIVIDPGHGAHTGPMCASFAEPRSRSATDLAPLQPKEIVVRKALPDTMFNDAERSRLSMLRSWVLDHKVTEIEMNEQQFWNFAQLQPVAEKPWTTFMGRLICVPDMPTEAQKNLGVFDRHNLGAI